ncbi:MAG TPA: cadmium resistance transporter [Ligilactobacillus acidipiscis]|uniref:Cadmium resistance transporter n=1 Tax=Ligilactobacillus acidipiscis TaxID=89059 RepID=A0A921JZN9_9LACO|nr:cadmium resistance transporter [Ligilactobacillus acidipiscis]
MGTAMTTGITAYISTSLDYLIILTAIFGSTPKGERFLVYLGDLLGTGILVGVSLLLAFVLKVVPAEWILGFLGLIPMFMGIKLFLFGEKEDDDVVEDQLKRRTNRVLKVILITVATCSADNIGVYVPLFAQSSIYEISIILLTFLVMLTIFCFVGYWLVKMPKIAQLLDHWGRYITSLVYLGIGLYILFESGAISHII